MKVAVSVGATGVIPGLAGSPSVPHVLLPPEGFDWDSGYTFFRTSSAVYSSDFDSFVLAPDVIKTYSVDPVGGSDAAAGTPEAPLKSLSVALGKSDVDAVEIINLAADFVARSTLGWNGVNVARSVRVRNQTGFRFISAFASATLPTFTAHASYANVYQSTTTAPTQMVDIASKTVPVRPITGTPITDVPTEFLTMTKVASPEAVRDLAGSWYHDGTVLYVRLFDNRTAIGDTKLIKCLSGVNGRAGGTNGTVVYTEGIDFVGGASAFNFATGTAGHTGTLITKNCTAQASHTTGNGFNVIGKIAVYHDHSAAYNNGLDGFSYHAFGSDGSDSVNSPTFIENHCVSKGSGTTGSSGGSDNASTSHEGADGISIDPNWISSDDRVLADVHFSRRWVLGGEIGPSVKSGAGSEKVVTLNSAQIWLDGTLVTEADGDRFSAGTGSAIRCRNVQGPIVNAVGAGGTVETY